MSAQARCFLLAACSLMTVLKEQLPTSRLCTAYCCLTPLVNTHAAQADPKSDINLLILKTWTQGAEVGLHLPSQLIVSFLAYDWLLLHS